jgi:hypothetical protein
MNGGRVSQSDAERWEDYLAAEILRKIQEIPFTEREGRVVPPYIYMRELAEDYQPPAEDITAEEARAYVARALPKKLFRDVFDAEHPLASKWVLNQATGIARGLAIRKQHMFARYCRSLVEPNDALGYAYWGLMKLSERMRDSSKEEVRKPYDYLASITRGLIRKDIDLRMKQLDPWSQAHYKLAAEIQKQLELTDNQDEDDSEEQAAEQATEILAKLALWLRRVDFGEAAEAATGDDVARLIRSDIMIELVEGIIARPPYTDTDRDTWRRWKAVDFHGDEIDWMELGLMGSTGPQRLLKLRQKLRKPLTDLGYPGS